MLTYHFSRQRAYRTKEVQFGLLSAEQTRRMATVTVSNPNIMHRGTPQTGAVNDLLMGSIDRRLTCSTCGGDVRTCQGHPGVIELGAPVYSIGFLDATLKCLRSVCYFCSRLLVSEAEAAALAGNAELVGKRLFLAVYQAARTRRRCAHCHGPQPAYQRVVNTIRVEWPAEAAELFEDEAERAEVTARVFTSIEAHSILDAIPDGDCRLMGFSTAFAHPRDMVQDVCHVIPPIARPAIMQSTGSRIRGQDDITHCLQSILKRSIDLKASMAAAGWDRTRTPTPELVDRLGKLQADVFAMVNNSVRGNRQAVQRSGAPFKSLVCRIRGKEGRIRGNLNGKRVDFSARSVVSPDPVMAVDEVGVPEAIALELTLQERVTHANVAELRQRVLAGARRLDGAQSVIARDGTVTQLEYCADRAAIGLVPGMVVERYMRDGDVVVFNRQPSLHKFSIMAHRARIMPGSTLRLNLSCTTAYNADFDGDEMNLHLLQSPLAIEEARGLMSVANNVMSPQSNRPVIAIVQDTLLGASLLTETGCLLTRKQYMRYACWIEAPFTRAQAGLPPPALLLPEPLWTGAQLFSALVPPQVTMWKGRRRPDWPAETDVCVRRGRLLHGRATKAVLGATAGGLVDCIARDVGARAIIAFESDIQRVVAQFLLQRGFSVKMSDCVLSDEGDAEVRELVRVATQNARAIVDAPLPETMRAVGESVVQNCLSKLLMQTGSIAQKHMRADNAIATMVHVGSKGSAINLCQIAGTVAQQTVEGRRIFSESADRTLPCYKRGGRSLESNGFVESNYQRGLTPQEFFFHSMGGREGLVDTAVKTACTGYIQRRQVKMTEDHHVAYDGTVRTAQNRILEFVYGGDGFDASRLERFTLRSLLMSDEEVGRRFAPPHGADATLAALLAEERALFDASNAEARRARISPMALALDPVCVLPFNPDRVLASVCEDAAARRPQALDAAYVAEVLELQAALCAEAVRTAPLHCLASALRFCFCSRALHDLALGAGALRPLFALLRQYLEEAAVAPGEMVGTIAATSMGEVTTQLTLNSVDWATVMAIRWTGARPPPAPADAEVGAFVDALMRAHPERVQWQPDGKTAYLPLPRGSAVALSPDEDGAMKWTELEAVTRHPPVNRDGSSTLIRITASHGHEVSVTRGKSLLVERGGKLVPVDGEEVEIGDRVPIVAALPAAACAECATLDLRAVFRPTEAVFADEAIAALEAPKKGQETPTATLPVAIPLDRDFGLLVGAYLAQGRLAEHEVRIERGDPDLCDAARAWTDRHAILSHVATPAQQTAAVELRSALLRDLLEKTCGSGPGGKRVPGFALAAPDEFVEGLLGAFFRGDGTDGDGSGSLSATTRSRALRDGISLLLSRFGVGAHLSTHEAHRHAERAPAPDGGARGDGPPMYRVGVARADARRFAQRVRTTRGHKRARRGEGGPAECEPRPLLNAVFLDEIVRIEEVDSTREHVYDLTVAGTRNMTVGNGFAVRDTFHTSGVGSRAVTAGIPRLKEILDVTRKMRTPSNCLVLRDPFGAAPDFAARFARTLGRTTLADLVCRTDLLFEPDPARTDLEGDRMMVEIESYLSAPPEGSSRWVARLVLSKTECQARDVTPPDIQALLEKKLGGEAHVVASQVNALEWCVRVRLARVRDMVARGFPNEPSASATLEETLVQRVVSRLVDSVQVAGHEDVQSAREREVEVWDFVARANRKRHVVDTLGTKLCELGLIPCVDWERSTTNNLHEVMETLGIEATLHVLFHEVRTTITGDGSYVDPRHMLQIAASMTVQGWLKAISRHGMNKPGSGTGPLVRCSFEETSDVLMDAALFGEVDDSRGVTSSIINGDMARIGSGAFDVLMPDRFLPTQGQQRPARSRLVKSRVRSVASEPPTSSVELVDPSLWSFNGNPQPEAVDVPFSEAAEGTGVSSHGQSGSGVYAHPPQPRRWEGIFAPSSPTEADE